MGAIISINGYSTPFALDMPAVQGLDRFGAPVTFYADGYTTSPPGTNTRPQTFSTEILAQPNNQASGTLTTASLTFSSVPVISLLGELYFVFVYDVAETGGNREIQVTNVNIKIPSLANLQVFTLTDIMQLNDDPVNANHTPGALNSSSSDMGFYVPVRIFAGLGLTGASQFTFTASWALGDNGGDRWVLTDGGIQGIAQPFFGASQSLVAVPEPATYALLGAGLLLAIRQRKAPFTGRATTRR
jgi:hypothetical protein